MTVVDHHHSHQSHDDQEPTKQSPPSVVVVVVVPFPLQSHLSQLLQLSHIISSHNIQVHYVGYALHISQVKSRASHALNDAKRIQFHDFPTPHFLSPLPTNTTFPSHLIPSFEASLNLRQPVMSLLTSLSKTAMRVVIIHDVLMSYVVQDSDSLPNTEAYIFHCVSAVSNFAFMRDAAGRHHDRPEIPSYEGCLVPEFEVFSNYQAQFLFKSGNKCGHLYNTCRLIDSEFLDSFLEEMRKIMGGNMKQWAIGPLETVTIFKNRSPNKVKGQGQNKCLEWLDKAREELCVVHLFWEHNFHGR
ncbi:hypothetical protein L484_016535 [Morus notabilis]|uniref:Glycosyltransferase N-terminal domain-containing protein n=1 Tax=Morus notabilis TaxID=981085 RepID=W9QKA3_9ROSA|nr:hypothetical protein L484_016535 [Morus notabilis]